MLILTDWLRPKATDTKTT